MSREVPRAGLRAVQGTESSRRRLVCGKAHWHTGPGAIQDEQTWGSPAKGSRNLQSCWGGCTEPQSLTDLQGHPWGWGWQLSTCTALLPPALAVPLCQPGTAKALLGLPQDVWAAGPSSGTAQPGHGSHTLLCPPPPGATSELSSAKCPQQGRTGSETLQPGQGNCQGCQNNVSPNPTLKPNSFSLPK